MGSDRSLAGTRGHQQIQRGRPSGYQKEVSVWHEIVTEELTLRIQGRIDGLLVTEAEVFGNPMFDMRDPSGILTEINACRKTFPNHYVRVTAFDSTQGVESPRMSYIVNRPKSEPGFGLVRQEIGGRQVQYTVHSYATDRPESERY